MHSEEDYAPTAENSHELRKRDGGVPMLAELDDEDLKNDMEDYTLTVISSMKVDDKVNVSLNTVP